jgi:hypothetical protein
MLAVVPSMTLTEWVSAAYVGRLMKTLPFGNPCPLVWADQKRRRDASATDRACSTEESRFSCAKTADK